MTAASNHRSAGPRSSAACGALILLIAGALVGCGKPNLANIELRKENQQLTADLVQAKSERDAGELRIRGLEAMKDTVPTLPTTRFASLFTAHGFKIGQLTGPADLDPKNDGNEGLKVYLVPLDERGSSLKATGVVSIDAFDTSLEGNQRIGHWEFTPEQMKKAWYGFLVESFIFHCPWQTVPTGDRITIEVRFTDDLTARPFEAQTIVAKNGPTPSTRPTAAALSEVP